MKKIVGLIFIIFCTKINAQEKLILVSPQMPQYVGGEKALLEYIHSIDFSKIKIKEEEHPTKTFVGFTIDTNGHVQDVYIKKSSGVFIYDSLLIEHIKQMPKWIPVEHNTQMILPFSRAHL